MMQVDGISVLVGVTIPFLGVLGVIVVLWLTEEIPCPFKRKNVPDHTEKATDDLIRDFLKRHGWETLDESEHKVPELQPAREVTVYDYYDKYWENRYREEYEKKSPKHLRLFRFNKQGECFAMEGTQWKAIVFELNHLLSL